MDKPNATYANIVHNFLYFVYIFSYSLNTLNKIAVDKLNNKNNKIKILICLFFEFKPKIINY